MLEISWEEAGFPEEASAEKVIKKFLKIFREKRKEFGKNKKFAKLFPKIDKKIILGPGRIFVEICRK